MAEFLSFADLKEWRMEQVRAELWQASALHSPELTGIQNFYLCDHFLLFWVRFLPLNYLNFILLLYFIYFSLLFNSWGLELAIAIILSCFLRVGVYYREIAIILSCTREPGANIPWCAPGGCWRNRALPIAGDNGRMNVVLPILRLSLNNGRRLIIVLPQLSPFLEDWHWFAIVEPQLFLLLKLPSPICEL